MKRESTIRKSIPTTKQVSRIVESDFNVVDLLKQAEDFALQNNGDVKDVYFSSYSVGYEDEVEASISIHVNKTPEEIEEGFQRELKLTRAKEAGDNKLYIKLLDEFARQDRTKGR